MMPGEFESPDQYTDSDFYQIYENPETGRKHIRILGRYSLAANTKKGFVMYMEEKYKDADRPLTRFLLEMDEALETGTFDKWKEKLCKGQSGSEKDFINRVQTVNRANKMFTNGEIKCLPITKIRRDHPVGNYVDRESFRKTKKKNQEQEVRETSKQRIQRLFGAYLSPEEVGEKKRGKM